MGPLPRNPLRGKVDTVSVVTINFNQSVTVETLLCISMGLPQSRVKTNELKLNARIILFNH